MWSFRCGHSGPIGTVSTIVVFAPFRATADSVGTATDKPRLRSFPNTEARRRARAGARRPAGRGSPGTEHARGRGGRQKREGVYKGRYGTEKAAA